MVSGILFLFTSFIITLVHAAPSPCTTEQFIGTGVVASRFNTVAVGCVVQVTPRAKPNLLYREYWLDERGRLMVFSSTPGDDDNKVTGTRTYFLFPRRALPAFAAMANGDLALTLGSGESVKFAGVNARVTSFPGRFQEAEEVSLENQGGFEIEAFNGIRLDSGWRLGSQAYKIPEGKSTFFDRRGVSCEIRNDEFFFYENMYYGEPNLRFPDDQSLTVFLRQRCPALDLSPLLAPTSVLSSRPGVVF